MRILLSAILALGLLSQTGGIMKPVRYDDKEAAAFHHIVYETKLEGASCSAIAIGPHEILTATHCELGSDSLKVDGTDYQISKVLRDNEDHSIIILADASFKYYLTIDQKVVKTEERVRGWGWPANTPHAVYKEGYYLNTDEEGGMIFVFPVMSGDSGGGVIDDSGHVITVVSQGNKEGEMRAFPLKFSPEQLAQVK